MSRQHQMAGALTAIASAEAPGDYSYTFDLPADAEATELGMDNSESNRRKAISGRRVASIGGRCGWGTGSHGILVVWEYAHAIDRSG